MFREFRFKDTTEQEWLDVESGANDEPDFDEEEFLDKVRAARAEREEKEKWAKRIKFLEEMKWKRKDNALSLRRMKGHR